MLFHQKINKKGNEIYIKIVIKLYLSGSEMGSVVCTKMALGINYSGFSMGDAGKFWEL
jgi:hypothetical protein